MFMLYQLHDYKTSFFLFSCALLGTPSAGTSSPLAGSAPIVAAAVSADSELSYYYTANNYVANHAPVLFVR